MKGFWCLMPPSIIFQLNLLMTIIQTTISVTKKDSFVELLSLTLIKQGYVDSKVKYLKYCILFQRNLPFVFTGSLGRGELKIE
jgi:hypothetical protein